MRKLDKKVADASVDEGYGRLDALNRIGNQVFALDLGKEGREKNYAATSAPVNFPHIWNTSWFDWVQYNASIQQPMVRNAGEALGVSAPVNLTDPKRGLFTSGVQVEKIHGMEKQLAGEQPDEESGFSGLGAPAWPENILGPIDRTLAAKGAGLYDSLCKGCHLPPVDTAEFWQSQNWQAPNKFGQRFLHVNVIPITKIGTDAGPGGGYGETEGLGSGRPQNLHERFWRRARRACREDDELTGTTPKPHRLRNRSARR